MSSGSEQGSTVPESGQDFFVAHRASEDSGSPAVVDMTVDDSDQEHQPARLIGNRFEVLSDEASESERPRRRLVLIQNPASDHEWDPDTESIGGASEVEVEDVEVESAAPDLPIPVQDRIHGVQRAFATLDVVDLIDVFSQRARVMHSVPWVIRGAF